MHILKTLFIIVALLLSSCAKQKETPPENKIEIYLTHHEVISDNCIPLLDYDLFWKNRFRDVPKEDYKEIIKYVRNFKVDTITKKMGRFNGKFSITKNDLESSPIVSDHEIKSYNLNNSTIEIDSTSKNRLLNRVENDKNYFWGKQFVLTYNNEIALFGYFVNAFSSTEINWYSIQLLKTNYPNKKSLLHLDKYYCNNDTIIPEISSNKAFIEAFRETNRLIE